MGKIPKEKIITIPNILSCFRIILIPVFIVFYAVYHNYLVAIIILLLSGITDAVDGFIARKFNMISNLGKALDPIADKLTQFSALVCLGMKFPLMFVLAATLAVKELASGILALIVVKKTKEVNGADWHGKISTFLLYAMMAIHIVWYEIPSVVSNILFTVCFCMVALSCVLYLIKHITALLTFRKNKTADKDPQEK